LPADVSGVALFEQALVACSRRHGLGSDAVLRGLEDGNPELHSSFRYGLAKALSEYLAGLGTAFPEIYVYGSSIYDTSNPASDIDVIVVVNHQTDEIRNLLRRVNLALTLQYRRLVGLKQEPTWLLDLHVIDIEERTEPNGVGAMIHGVHTRPLCLWRSHPANTGALRPEGSRRSVHSYSKPSAAIER